LLRKYDRDGDGSFSKEEVVAIILDLREAMASNEMLGASNKLFRRMLIGVSAFAILLLTSMFGLSYAVAALTAKLDVNSDGTMTTADGKTVVATDTSSYKVVATKGSEDVFCFTNAEKEDLLSQATSGRTNVMVEFNGVNGTQTVLQQLNGGQVFSDEDTVCFVNSQGTRVCLERNENCISEPGRRLQAASNCFATGTGDSTRVSFWNANIPSTTNCYGRKDSSGCYGTGSQNTTCTSQGCYYASDVVSCICNLCASYGWQQSK